MRRSEAEIAAFIDDRARTMRKFPTSAEALLRDELYKLPFWLRQVPITGKTKNGGRWSYVLDFAWFPEGPLIPRLCIEVDGSAHRRTRGRDRRRDTRLATIGIRTIRVSNHEVLRDVTGVLATIQRAMAGEEAAK